MKKIVLSLLATLFPGLAVANEFSDLSSLYNSGTTFSPETLPEHGVFNAHAVYSGAIEGRPVRYVFWKKVASNGSSVFRFQLIFNESLSNEDAVAHAQACDGIIPAAEISASFKAVAQWQNFQNLRQFAPSYNLPRSQSLRLLRSAVDPVSGEAVIVGRYDIREPGGFVVANGVIAGAETWIGRGYFKGENVQEVEPSVVTHAYCHMLVHPDYFIRIW